MPELKPCPFCGQQPTVCPDDSYGHCIVSCHCEAEPCVMRQIVDLEGAVAAWNTRPKDYREALCFIGKWVERGLFCKTTSPQDALNVIAHFPGMPWNSERWDVDHKPYAEAFYKMFPETREAGDGDL